MSDSAGVIDVGVDLDTTNPTCLHAHSGTVLVSTLTIRLQFNPDFDHGFPRSEVFIHAHVREYNSFGARKSSIEMGVELQSNLNTY